jgi:uncharacterized damage-inducible protein DinB
MDEMLAFIPLWRSLVEDQRYPIGKLNIDPAFDAAARAAAIEAIARLPGELTTAVRGLDDAQLDTPYREGGWTVRQVVHHLADSHLNAYVRCKLIASEAHPPLKGYDDNAWSEMADAKTLPVSVSLQIIEGLHARWVAFLKSLAAADFARTGAHTENGSRTLDHLLQIYGWHGPHHVAHVTALRQRRGW